MEVTPEEELAAQRAREVLERLLRPRAEILAEKQAKAQQLAQSLGQDRLTSPMFLVDPDTPITLSDAPEEKQRRFIQAVQKNIRLQKELSRLRAEHKAAAATAPTPASSSKKADAERTLLAEQLECNRLEKERKRLEALKRYYDQMNNQPAATPDFLDPKVMFKDCAAFPELPKELVEGFTKEGESPEKDIEELVSRLRKATLRQKLVLENDQRKLEALKARHPINPRDLSLETQVTALNAVKNSLVDWIETMLSKAGEGEGETAGGAESPSKTTQLDDGAFDVEARSATIQKEYERHIDLRRQILTSMAQLRKLAAAEPPADMQEPVPEPPLPAKPEPQTYLLTPYLEKLQTLSQEQKAMVQEKTHINATMARQQQETTKAIRRLEQESTLLSKYGTPQQDKSHASSSFAEATKTASVTEQIQPWLFAADSAKITTLETVAEEVEKGQMSIQEAMNILDQVSKLQNKGPLQVPSEGSRPGSEDRATKSTEEDRKNSTGSVKSADKKEPKNGEKSIWATLDGNLGLINE
ncbi:hypothetical protein GGS20DRAFT_561540 [Poronia punctata]|nr:hypothetical protein GGS20DRAFT_561540 [Poronia punctata]